MWAHFPITSFYLFYHIHVIMLTREWKLKCLQINIQ